MINLFFIMLVLYVLTSITLNLEREKIKIKANEYEKIQKLQQAIAELDSNYFEYNTQTKRFKMKIEVNFPPNSSNIYELSEEIRAELVEAGEALYRLIDSLGRKTSGSVEYLVVIEGTAQRPQNWEYVIDEGYKLSYKRSLSLFNFWKTNGLDFYDLLPESETIIAGSGYFGASRDTVIEENNRRFTIQITPKVGNLKQ